MVENPPYLDFPISWVYTPCAIRGVAQSGQRTAFGTRGSEVQILSPRLMVKTQVKRIRGPKYDGVVEAVHLTSSGKIEWVRVFERRGPTWSDNVLLDRETLIERLKSGKKFVTGKRIVSMASEFEVSEEIELRETGKGDVIVSGKPEGEKDWLEGVPEL